MTATNAAGYYQLHINEKNAQLTHLLKKRKWLGWTRLLVFVLTIAVAAQVFISSGLWGLIPLTIGIGILLYLVSLDVNNNDAIHHLQTLLRIYEEELRVLHHDFTFREDGAIFAPQDHPYANDLDLFGKSSLFQWMNRCHSESGKRLLAANMLEPLPPEQVLLRQEALTEFMEHAEWRHHFQAYGEEHPITRQTENRTKNWLDEPDQYFTGKHWKLIILLYPVITLGSAVAAMLGFISAGSFSFLYGLYLATSIILSRNTIKPYLHLSGIVKEITTMQKQIGWIESKNFKSALLSNLQKEARVGNTPAAGEIKNLRSILDRFDLRLNIAGLLFFNSFLLWDVRQMMALNHWRKINRTRVPHWFHMIAEMELVHSLATIRFHHPEWCLPVFTHDHFTFSATALGHPLISDATRITSDFSLHGTPKVALVTGSNMAGKSTFLRSLGVNTIMAQMGAPVCARAMLLSPVHLMSSMRIADNLAENTSTFYAELKKLKTIIEAVRRHEKIFILLDEILRGTNSLDRHTGSAALIRQLVAENAVAVIATHDLELAQLSGQFPTAIENYHFDVQVEGEELYFDYLLKNGVCNSLNASILMKKIGIELP